MSSEYVKVNITKKLYQAIEQQVDASLGGFNSVSEYIEFAVSQILREVTKETNHPYTPKDESEIKKRLQQLGYI